MTSSIPPHSVWSRPAHFSFVICQLLILFLLALSPGSGSAADPRVPASMFGVNAQSVFARQLFNGVTNNTVLHLQAMTNMGISYVRQDLSWSQVQFKGNAALGATTNDWHDYDIWMGYV